MGKKTIKVTEKEAAEAALKAAVQAKTLCRECGQRMIATRGGITPYSGIDIRQECAEYRTTRQRKGDPWKLSDVGAKHIRNAILMCLPEIFTEYAGIAANPEDAHVAASRRAIAKGRS